MQPAERTPSAEYHHHRRKKLLKRRRRNNMVKLSWWEEFIIGAAISFLMMLKTKITNPTELAALEAALTFLQKLMTGTVALHAA